MTNINTERRVVRTIVLLAIALNVTLLAVGCDRRAGDPLLTGPDPRMAAAWGPGEVNIFIRPGGEYQIGGDDVPFREAQLSERLRNAYSRAPARARSLNIYAYEGVVGYDVVMAIHAARENGIEQVRGIANYGDSGLSRLKWSRWDLKLTPENALAVARDTLRR